MGEEESPGKTWIIVAGVVALLAVVVFVWFFGFRASDARISGQVTLDNEPVAGAQVVFVGEDEKNQTPFVAQTNDAGHYQLAGSTGGGIPTGKYRVVVSKMTLKDGTVPPPKQLGQARASGLLLNILPKVYEDRTTTPFQFDVSRGATTINLEMKKQP